MMGLVYVHPYAQNSDLSTVSTSDITTTTNSQGGTVTSYFVRTEQLPLTMALRQLGVPATIVDGIDKVLRPIIDAGYSRNPSNPPSAPPSLVSSLYAPHRSTLQRNAFGTPAAASKAVSRASAAQRRQPRVRAVRSEAGQRRSVSAYARPQGSFSQPGAVETSWPR